MTSTAKVYLKMVAILLIGVAVIGGTAYTTEGVRADGSETTAKDGTRYKPIDPPPVGYVHDKWVTEPRDHVFEFKAYTTSFDGADDVHKLGVPEWVAFKVQRKTIKIKVKRPSRWAGEETLPDIVPKDNSYHVKRSVKEKFPYSLTYNLSRGHMCPKNIANRLGADADHNTHTTLNACPQWQWHNNGIWKDMERLTENWADEWGQLWVICGPIFLDQQPRLWLGEDGEKLIAIPDAFYKIIIHDNLPMAEPQVKAFIYPHAIRPSDNRKEYDHRKFLVSVDDIEKRTGLDFFTALSDDGQDTIEGQPAWDVWDDPGSYHLP